MCFMYIIKLEDNGTHKANKKRYHWQCGCHTAYFTKSQHKMYGNLEDGGGGGMEREKKTIHVKNAW